jgi:Uma2 family endonuclease
MRGAMTGTRMDVLTEAQWEALPDTSELELVDGIVRTRVAWGELHNQVRTALRNALAVVAPDGLVVTTNQEVRLSEAHRRRPDVLVVRDDALDLERWHLLPEDVVLAVEVVRRGSETTDRKHKPTEYADADIPHYWRVETLPGPVVHTYRLGESSHYLETGLFRPGDLVSDPTLRWATFEVDALLG